MIQAPHSSYLLGLLRTISAEFGILGDDEAKDAFRDLVWSLGELTLVPKNHNGGEWVSERLRTLRSSTSDRDFWTAFEVEHPSMTGMTIREVVVGIPEGSINDVSLFVEVACYELVNGYAPKRLAEIQMGLPFKKDE